MVASQLAEIKKSDYGSSRKNSNPQSANQSTPKQTKREIQRD
jgi:hypothetical protein